MKERILFETQTTETRIDEFNRCRDRSWLSGEDETRFGVGSPQAAGENQKLPYDGLIHIGQQVFVQGEKNIGLTTKMFIGSSGNISHLAVRAAQLFGRHKMVPIEMVNDVTPLRVSLSISREEFQKLPEYRADSDIAEDVDRALWGDLVLRSTDYREIDTQVRDGVITLNGHVTTGMNQWRAETAVKDIPGILGLKSYLIPDDKLALIVAEAVGQVNTGGIGNIFAKVDNGFVLLIGEASSISIRDQVEQRVSEIPWVRGIVNELRISGSVSNFEDTRILQPLIGKELIFLDAVSVTVWKVIINPHNRRVVGILVLGQFPSPAADTRSLDNQDQIRSEQLKVLPVGSILHLTSSAGFIGMNSDETSKYEDYDSSQYVTPGENWLPPYPYCTEEVLFLAKPDLGTEELNDRALEKAVNRFDNEGGHIPEAL